MVSLSKVEQREHLQRRPGILPDEMELKAKLLKQFGQGLYGDSSDSSSTLEEDLVSVDLSELSEQRKQQKKDTTTIDGESGDMFIEDMKILESRKDNHRGNLFYKKLKVKTAAKKKDKPNKVIRRRTTLESKNDDSDNELPSCEKFAIPKVTDKEYLKLFRMKNSTHDTDRERAVSIVANLVMPNNIKTLENNPFMNKTPLKEVHLNLHAVDLMHM